MRSAPCFSSTPINHIFSFFCRIPVLLESPMSSQWGGGYAPPARAPKICPCLQCPEPSLPQWAARHCKANSVLLFCLPRLHLITVMLSMKHWIRRTAPVSPLLFVHTRQRDSKRVNILPCGKWGAGEF